MSLRIGHRPSPPTPNTRARATHRVLNNKISQILCHRQLENVPEFLVLWRTNKDPAIPSGAPCSWHNLEELSKALHFVQAYIEELPPPGSATARDASSLVGASESRPLKRKTPGTAAATSRDTASTSNGLLTPLPSHLSISRSPSVSSSDATPLDVEELQDWRDITVYNAVLRKKEGCIYTMKPKSGRMNTINARHLPTREMHKHAAANPGPIIAAERAIRNAFMQKLSYVPGIHLKNEVDGTTPSLDFDFIEEFILGEGVHVPDPEAFIGCYEPCKPNMGGNCGCEYTKQCACLEYAAVDEKKLRDKDPDRYALFKEQQLDGGMIDTEGLPKRFPYSNPKVNSNIPPVLQEFYRESRHAIYECNDNCTCGPKCKTRLIDKGRHVELTIFKTANRGWGVSCNEDLIKGEFIDVYLGEVLTNEETTIREEKADMDKGSYLYNLDKFVGDYPDLTQETCYVVDGQYKGNATRFMNHSCEPNCRQYTVSQNKYDPWLYNLAFFAYEDIPAGQELTFDYLDRDEEEEVDAVKRRAAAMKNPENEDARPCNCGAPKCRGFLWS